MSWFPSSPTPGRGAHDDGVLVMPVLGASASLWMWYVARAAGMVSLLLLTGSVLLGILTSVRWFSDRWPRVHDDARAPEPLTARGGVPRRARGDGRDRRVRADPVARRHRAVRIVVSSVLARSRDGRVRSGPALIVDQLAAYPHRAAAVAGHALVGVCVFADRGGPRHGNRERHRSSRLVLIVNGVCVTAVIVAIWWRIRPALVPRPAVRGWVLAATIVAPIALLGRLVAGPLVSGWASRLGTPGLAAPGRAKAPRPRAPRPRRRRPASRSRGPSVRRFRQPSWVPSLVTDGANQAETLQFDAPLTDRPGFKLVVVLQGTNNGGGLIVRSGTADHHVSDEPVRVRGDHRLDRERDAVHVGVIGITDKQPMAIQMAHLDVPGGVVSGSVSAARTSPRSSSRGDDH